MKKFIFIFLFFSIIFLWQNTNFCKSKNLTFAVFGDCHLSDETSLSEKILAKIVEAINTSESNPEFVVCLGDIVAYPVSVDKIRYEKALDKYIAYTRMLKVPVYTIPGNHDLEGGREFEEIFQKKMGNFFFNIERKNFLLFFLDSENMSETQISWLREKIKKTHQKKIVFMHKPVLPTFTGKGYGLDIKVLVHLKAIFENNNVTTVISGHEHFFYTKKTGKLTQVISGGAGGKLAPAPEGGISNYHYCIITIKDNGSVRVKPVFIKCDERN
ncbi:MAG: metallophosphoesterase [Candidatus Omnitrophica bacterium]|nr:metallophosphoesterase [Candidatus Omnitrophota bacterium]